MVPEPVLKNFTEVLWRVEFQIHAHANGDAAVDRFLNIIKDLQIKFPRPDHRSTVEHLPNNTEQQNQGVHKLGAQAYVNSDYHLFYLELTLTAGWDLTGLSK